jgi:SAM-dependent methyltransferase
MAPGDVALNHSQLLFTRVLAGKKRVLEVGCGNGQLAWRLAHLGHTVVGLDIALPRQRPSHPKLRFEKLDFYKFKDELFDAILFTSSLHHLNPLDGALKRARTLLSPGGLVVLEEFDLLAPDAATARWYYEAQDLLEQAGLFRAPGHSSGSHPRAGHAHHHTPAAHGRPEGVAPLARWQKEHQHLPALHSGQAMLAALKKLGEAVEVSRGPYLYRSLAARLAEGPRAHAVADWLFHTEDRRIRAGSLEAVGLRAVFRLG